MAHGRSRQLARSGLPDPAAGRLARTLCAGRLDGLPGVHQQVHEDLLELPRGFGKGFTGSLSARTVVHAEAAGDAQCLNPFAAGTWSGEIVVCDRGTIARTQKGENVLAGGAGGLVLANALSNGESVANDLHVLPAVHIGYTDAVALRAWLDSGSGHVASISGATLDVHDSNGDIMADFSSRGANRALPDILKPDVAAPGIDVIAAVGVGDPMPGEWSFISGTSMASPHVAGAGALIASLRPDWTPAEIQSALMMTAEPSLLKEDQLTPTDPFDVGAGRVEVGLAVQAGLVLDETVADFTSANPAIGGDPKRLNLASLANAGSSR